MIHYMSYIRYQYYNRRIKTFVLKYAYHESSSYNSFPNL